MKTDLSLDLHRGDESFVVECYYTRDKGCVSGPPENCREPHESLEVIAVFGADEEKISDFVVTESEIETLTEKAREAINEAEERYGGDDDDE